MRTTSCIIKIYFFTIITILSIFTAQAFAQTLFSGLILSERKDGLMVIETQEGSPAFNAGLKAGDVVVEVDGKKIKSIEEYVNISGEVKKKVETSLTIRREGVLYEAVIRIYSIPIHEQWDQKVTKPIELPKGLTDSPYGYWSNKGRRTLKKFGKTAPFEENVEICNEAIKYFFNSLHYQTDSINTALLIAKLYHELGKLYQINGNTKESIKYYKNSIKLNTGCLKKTKKEDYLKLILVNLQDIEKGLSKIETGKAAK